MSGKNRKTEIKEGGAYLGLPLCSPAAAGRPSQQAAQPTWPPSSIVFLPDRETARARRARTAAPRHLLPPCLPVLPSSLWMDRTTPRNAPHLSPTLSFLPLPWFSLSRPPERARRHRSP